MPDLFVGGPLKPRYFRHLEESKASGMSGAVLLQEMKLFLDKLKRRGSLETYTDALGNVYMCLDDQDALDFPNGVGYVSLDWVQDDQDLGV